VHVVGVVTEDDRARAASLAQDLGLTFPSLYDRDGELLAALGRTGLPVTLFVDAAGAVRFTYQAEALDEMALQRLVEEHLGVALAGGAPAGER
jgi:peroxiredoxin